MKTDPWFYSQNHRGQPTALLYLDEDEFDEILDCMYFARQHDPECDVEFNRMLRARLVKKRKQLRQYTRQREAEAVNDRPGCALDVGVGECALDVGVGEREREVEGEGLRGRG